MAILKHENKVEFDPTNREHLVAYKNFLEHRNVDGVQSVAWGVCPFAVKHPYLDAVTCINAEIAQHFLRDI